MQESRRAFKRLQLPLQVRFRPTYGATAYSTGTAKNLSIEGLGLDADDFSFILYEHLELLIGLPESKDHVCLFGDIVWKKQTGKRCLAGIQFRMKNKNIRETALETICASSQMSLQSLYSNDPDYMVHAEEVTHPLSGASVPCMKPEELPNKLGFIKHYHENSTKCSVTFRMLRETACNARNVSLVGDFNDWNATRTPMMQLENGDFIITIDLDSGREYRFRYCIDGNRWVNDWYADRFVPNKYGSKDSVVIV